MGRSEVSTETTQEAAPIAVTRDMLTEALDGFRLGVWGGSREHRGPVADPGEVAGALHATLSRIAAGRAADGCPACTPADGIMVGCELDAGHDGKHRGVYVHELAGVAADVEVSWMPDEAAPEGTAGSTT